MKNFISTIFMLALLVVAASVMAEPVWVQSCALGSRGHVVVDDNGSIYGIGADCSLSKFDAVGELLWSRPGPSSSGFNSATRDAQGNFYLCGAQFVSGGTTDILVTSFSPSGSLRWQQTYNGPVNLNDKAGAITVAGDRVVVVGTVTTEDWPNGDPSYNSLDGSDIVTLCYTTSGTLLWAKQQGCTLGDLWYKGGTGVAIDGEGNAYAAGFAYYFSDPIFITGEPSLNEIVLLKYSPDGEAVWEQDIELFTSAARAQSDKAGNLLVAATAGQAGRTIFLAKFAPDGTKLWQTGYDGPLADSLISSNDRFSTMVVGDANEVYVAASSSGTSGWAPPGVLLAKYSSAGTREWVQSAGGSGRDDASGIAITPIGNLIITGSMGTGMGIIGEYTPAGDNLWLDTLSGVYKGIRDVDIDPTGAAIVSDRSTKLAKYQVSCCVGRTGDLDVSGRTDLTDLSIMISYLLGSGPVRMCPGKADLNGLDGINLTDLSTLIAYLLAGGVELPACP